MQPCTVCMVASPAKILKQASYVVATLMPLDMPENLMDINFFILHVVLLLANECL